MRDDTHEVRMLKASLFLLLTLIPAQAAVTTTITPVVSFQLSGDPGPPVWAQVAVVRADTAAELAGLTWSCDNAAVITHIGTTHGYIDENTRGFERLAQVGVEPDAVLGDAACVLYQGTTNHGSLMLDWWNVD